MGAFTFLEGFFSKFQIFDWIALVFFLAGLIGYRYFLSFMLRNRPNRLYLGKLQQYRKAWIDAHSGAQNSIMVVQTLRNTIMSASFLASTAVILIMGAVNLLFTLESSGKPQKTFYLTAAASPEVMIFKVLMLIVVLSYSFFNFTWYIRESNYMGFILNIPKATLDEIEGGDSTPHIERMFLTSGIYFSLGMRGYYFLIPLLMWLFSPLLMILASLVIFFILLRRDLAG